MTGNKDIKTEDLEDSLRGVGLARGRTFERAVLEEVQQFLIDQYFSRGKYSVAVDTEVTENEAENTVDIAITVKEGERARIKQILIVGNEVFSDEELREEFELRTPNWLSWYRRMTGIRGNRWPAISRSCSRFTWTAATRASRSSPPRCRSRRTGRASISP
jgi:outer membrane protein insertion porin family